MSGPPARSGAQEARTVTRIRPAPTSGAGAAADSRQIAAPSSRTAGPTRPVVELQTQSAVHAPTGPDCEWAAPPRPHVPATRTHRSHDRQRAAARSPGARRSTCGSRRAAAPTGPLRIVGAGRRRRCAGAGAYTFIWISSCHTNCSGSSRPPPASTNRRTDQYCRSCALMPSAADCHISPVHTYWIEPSDCGIWMTKFCCALVSESW